MLNLVRRGSLTDDLSDLRRNFDEMFQRLTNSWPLGAEEGPPTLMRVAPVEAWVDREAKQCHIRVALPGVDPKDVEVNVQGNTLSISGEQKRSHESKGVTYQHREFAYGRFERTIELPDGVDRERISADYNNGVLELVAPIAAAAMPRRIEVKTAPKSKVAGA
jgi:HSP20 family protein